MKVGLEVGLARRSWLCGEGEGGLAEGIEERESQERVSREQEGSPSMAVAVTALALQQVGKWCFIRNYISQRVSAPADLAHAVFAVD